MARKKVGDLPFATTVGRGDTEFGGADTGTANASGSGRAALGALAWTWRDIQQARLAAQQRGHEDLAELLEYVENAASKAAIDTLKSDPIWPWLDQYPGLRGVHAARLVALIGDSRRFPGQQCTEGHYHPAIYEVGSTCTATLPDDSPCPGTLLPRRDGTGTRSLWHYLGLHVVDGKAPRRKKGEKADWNPIGRTICLQPMGLAEQAIRHKALHGTSARQCKAGADCKTWALIQLHDETKARLAVERGIIHVDGADADLASEERLGPVDVASESQDSSGGADVPRETETNAGLRPFQVERIAQTIMVKRFVGDLLAAMKRVDGQAA